MSLVALDGTPLMVIGAATRHGYPLLGTLGSTTCDATNEACIMYGHMFWSDGGSHTVDTSGSSALGWRTGSTTFANGATVVKAGLAALDTTTGVPARAANTTNVINFDVAAVFTGSGITSASWQESVPTTGTKTIANGDALVFAVQVTNRAGADSILVSHHAAIATNAFPGVTDFTGASYTNANRYPNVVIRASDGTYGWFWGGAVASVGATTQTWNNTSGTTEYGNLIQLQVPAKAYGVATAFALGGDCDFILYSAPLGTPVAEKTVSVDKDTVAVSTLGLHYYEFASPFSMTANTAYAVIAKPTSATDVSMNYRTYNAAVHQASDSLGSSTCYAINRASGAFAAQNSSKDRFVIGLVIAAFDDGAGSGSSGGFGSLIAGGMIAS